METLTLRLRDGTRVDISKKYYDDLIAIGVPDYTKWKISKNRVLVRYKHRDLAIARIVSYTTPGWRIDYHDGNPFNLTIGNLGSRLN
jgi:hypothetical protein